MSGVIKDQSEEFVSMGKRGREPTNDTMWEHRN